MGVYIKGMKMPTSCYDCNCFIRDSDGSDYCCLLMQDIEDNHKRDDDCPLVHAPPHGRLIDADMLEKLYEEQRDYFWHWLDKSENPASEAMGYGINWCINTLHDNAIAVIPGDEET